MERIDTAPAAREGSAASVALAVALLLALAACSSPSPPPTPQTRAEAVPARDLVAEVRAAASGEDALEVEPLRDAGAEDWRLAAKRHEQDGDMDAAADALERALALAPHDPELLQFSAELALARGDGEAAEKRAWSAFQHGPGLGPLCRRNWAAIRIARELRGDEAGAEVAREQAGRCAHQPPVRM